MNNNFRLLLLLLTLFLILLINGFSCVPVNQKVTVKEKESESSDISKSPEISAYDLGQKLFETNCRYCHNKNMKSHMTAPALGGVLERWSGDTTNLYSFIRNSQAYLAQENDTYALTLYKDWGNLPMIPFPELTDEELDAILVYINTTYKS